MTRSDFPPAIASLPTHFVIRVGGKAAGFMESRSKADELARLLNAIPGCPTVTIDELPGPFPSHYDEALAAVRAGTRSRRERVDIPAVRPRPALRLVRGGG